MLSRDGRAAWRLVHRNGVLTGITSVGAGDDAALLMNLVERGAGVEFAKAHLGGRRWTVPRQARRALTKKLVYTLLAVALAAFLCVAARPARSHVAGAG